MKPATPSYWNTLPRDYTQIPEVVFTHVDHTETEYRRLQELFRRLQGSTNGFVLRYLSFPGEPAVQEIPLWALCHAVAIVGFTLQKRFRIHVAACLTPADESVLTTEIFRDIRLRTVNCRQYCVVPVVNLPDPVFMRMNLPPPGRPENIPEETFNVLNEFLYTI